MSNLFNGTGVKRYALRYRANFYSVWEYPPELNYDTLEEAEAALEAMETSGYQVAEKFPCIILRPSEGVELPRSKLLNNVLAECGTKPYRLQWTNGHGWRNCPDLQFDTLEEARAAAWSGRVGMYRVMAATLDIRYEPAREVS